MQCNYVFKKGKNKGEFCNKKALEINKCRQHCKILKNLSNHSLKSICYEWNKNKYINPISNRKIKSTGKVYKDLVRKCANFNFDLEELALSKKTVLFSTKKRTKENINVRKLIYNRKKYDIPNKIKSWILQKILDTGGFGVIYNCIHETELENDKYVIKIEAKESYGLKNEFNFYNKYKNVSVYFSKVYDMGTTKELRYIVFEKLYKLNLGHNVFSEIITAISVLAQYNFSHCDIKFDNVMMRKNGQIVLNDMGMITKLNSTINNGGTPLYISLNAYNSNHYLKNDLESFAYCILELVNKLPWEDYYKGTNTSFKKVQELKKQIIIDILSNGKWSEKYFNLKTYLKIKLFCKYVFNLKNNDIPDYKFLILLFSNKNIQVILKKFPHYNYLI